MQTQPINFNPPTQEAPFILLPVKTSVFADRADRFERLAAGHSLGEWLAFLGQLSRAQHDSLQSLPVLALPDAAALEQARTHRMPPLHHGSMARPAAWIEVLRQIAKSLEPGAPEATAKALSALREAPAERLEKLAGVLLSGEPEAVDGAELPFVAAALQVVWTALASQQDATTLQSLDTHGVCPCCGSLPVGSIVRISSTVNNLRYLHCSLCNTEWNLPRTTCAACNDEKNIGYQQIEGSSGAVRAETCDGCKSYLKIHYQEKDARVDPVADDLATLALDILVDEAGCARSGPNLLLIGGAAE